MKKQAFTLVELLVVMVIIGIIIGLAVFGLSSAQKSAKDTDKKNTLNQVSLALESYKDLNRKYYCPNSSNPPACSGTLDTNFIKAINADGILKPASGTNWPDYSYNINGQGVFYISTKVSSVPSNCKGDTVYFGGGVSSSGLSPKEVYTSVSNGCWLN